jgi:thiamine transporter ThiT
MRLSSSQGNLHFILDKLHKTCQVDVVLEYLLAVADGGLSVFSGSALGVLVLDDFVDSADEGMFKSSSVQYWLVLITSGVLIQVSSG